MSIQINLQLEESIAVFAFVHFRLAEFLMDRSHVILMAADARERLHAEIASDNPGR